MDDENFADCAEKAKRAQEDIVADEGAEHILANISGIKEIDIVAAPARFAPEVEEEETGSAESVEKDNVGVNLKPNPDAPPWVPDVIDRIAAIEQRENSYIQESTISGLMQAMTKHLAGELN